MARISLCLIARDEERMLPDCLASVAGAVDEIVVADTGSIDRTAEVARAAGARVVHHPWLDDFAAARNAALAQATGDWILVLDADERLAPGAAAAIRAAVARNDLDCGLMPLHNASRLDATPAQVISGAARTGEAVLLPRLIRRTPDLRWEGIIHESIASWLVRGGRRASQVPADIVHLGSVPSVRAAKNKLERNVGLLVKRCAEEPDNPTAHTYLAAEYLKSGQGRAGRAVVEAGWRALEKAMAGPGARPTVVTLTTMRSQLQLAAGEPEAGLATLDQAITWGGRHPNLDWIRAKILVAQAAEGAGDLRGRLEAADAALHKCLAQDGRRFAEEPIPGVTSYNAWTLIGLVRLLQERPAEALEAFERTLAEQPGWLAGRLGRCEALIEGGRAVQALQELEPMLVEESPDAWVLAASACDALRAVSELPAMLRTARAKIPNGWVAPHRAALLESLTCAADMYAGTPRPGPGPYGTLGALMTRTPLETSNMPPEPRPLIRQVTQHLVNLQRPDLIETLLEARAESVVPGIAEIVYETLSELGIQVSDDGEPDFIFVGGAGRSGTTLFRAMLDAHPRILCGPEIKLVSAICQIRADWWRASGADLSAAGVREEDLDAAVRAFVDTLLRRLVPPGSKLRVAEKTPHNLVHTAYLGRLFPRARFVHVIRDGRAVAASLVQQRWIDPSTGQPIWYCKDVRSAARYWASIVQTVRQQAAMVPDRYHEVRYEDLVRDPETEMRRVLAFLGEPWDPAVLRHEREGLQVSARESSSAAVAHAVHTKAIEKWRSQLTNAQQRAVEDEVGTTLAELEYR